MSDNKERVEYTSVSLPKVFVNQLKEHIEKRKDLAYDSVAEYVRSSVNNQVQREEGKIVDRARWDEILEKFDKIERKIDFVEMNLEKRTTPFFKKSELFTNEHGDISIDELHPAVLNFLNQLAQNGYDFSLKKNGNEVNFKNKYFFSHNLDKRLYE